MARLPVAVLAASLVANWVASENLTGLTGAVACGRAFPEVLLDPLGPALCLVLLGLLLARHVGRYSCLSDLMVDRYGLVIGGIAASLAMAGSIVWAAAQYKAVVQLLGALVAVRPGLLEALVTAGLLTWCRFGGLVADVWLDSLSMLVVAPCVLALAAMASWRLGRAVFQEEAGHAASVVWARPAANLLAVGALGNLFTEELAGRVLLAASPSAARSACLLAAAAFSLVGLAPVALGLWVRTGGLLGDGTACEDRQDSALPAAVHSLLGDSIPGKQHGANTVFTLLLILECLNTLDTSILMCSSVLDGQLRRAGPRVHRCIGRFCTPITLAAVVLTSWAGSNVWALAREAVEVCGAPLAVICLMCGLDVGGSRAALAGVVVAQLCYLLARFSEPLNEVAFLAAVVSGVCAYAGSVAADIEGDRRGAHTEASREGSKCGDAATVCTQ